MISVERGPATVIVSEHLYHITPLSIFYGTSTQHDDTKRWYLDGVVEGEIRNFAMEDIEGWVDG